MDTRTTRILLVDDHRLIVEALTALLSAQLDFEVVGNAGDCDQALQLAEQTRPDIAILDVEIPGNGCFALALELRDRVPGIKLIFLTGHVCEAFVGEAVRVGAVGYLLKGDDANLLCDAIRAVMRGECVFSAAVQQLLDQDPLTGAIILRREHELQSLSSRQLEVLRHLARGQSVKEIAREMHLSQKSVDSHKYRIMSKLGIHDRVELARYAIREGLTQP